MLKRTFLTLAAACVLVPSVADAAPERPTPKARRQFAALVAPRGAVRARQDVSNLDPAAVQNFDYTLTRYLRRNGLVPPRATSRLSLNRVGFRRRFIFDRFTPGAAVGGVFFSTSATPSSPTGPVNPTTFFPVYTAVQ